LTEQTGPTAASGSAGEIGQDVEYRLSRRYRRPMLTRFAFMVVLTVICIVSGLKSLEFVAYPAGALAVIFGVMYLWQGRFVTRVTSRGIEARGYFNHFVPWHEVRDIEVDSWSAGRLAADEDYGSQMYASASSWGRGVRMSRASPNRMGRIASIKVVRANGSKLLLRAPLVSGWASDPDFDDKAKQLQQLSARYGRSAIS
jgi:hypothetical protein